MQNGLSEPMRWRWAPEPSSPSRQRRATIGHVPESGKSENPGLLTPATVDAVHERLDLIGSLSTQLTSLEAQHRQLAQLLEDALEEGAHDRVR